ncbi:MAG: hypothetical protein SGJ10_07700 [Bacteroidota bacterium]|nr:hypothetical protein [Bacteroidota bacterium]
MKKIIKLTTVLLFAVMIAGSCNKQKKLMNRLVGTWNIDKLEGTYTGATTFPYSYTNAGTYIFTDDGKGTFSYTLNGSVSNGSFIWANTETTVTMTQTGYSPKVNTVTSNSKTKQEWSFNYTDAGSTNVGTITLSKK